MATATFGPERRRETLARMASEEFDIVVIGGGVTGAGIALDAATRGLSVALVEQRDFASGTSSRSSKLIHGGLRYLEQLNFGLVREALKERGLMLERLCPHLVKPVPFLFPMTHRAWERFYIGSGVLLYDTIGGAGSVPRHKHLSKTKALELFPSLHPDRLTGAIRYYDAQVDDARHTMMIARTAARFGALCATSARVTDLLTDDGRVVGARVRDLEDGEEDFELRGRHTINATGVWTDEVLGMISADAPFKVRASKGIHFTVPRRRIHADTGLIIRTETSVLFVIPWKQHWIIGTTDTDWHLDLAHPAATRSDIDYLLDHVNSVLIDPLTHDDIEGVYAGLRPLLSPGEGSSTSALSREHAVAEVTPGLSAISGGKYTTYRVMAKDAVDFAAQQLGSSTSSVTEEVPILGADGYAAMWNARQRIAQERGLSVETVEHLLNRYGSLIEDIFALMDEREDLAKPLEGAETYLAAEVAYAASHEGALHLEDVLTRRTRITFEVDDRGRLAARMAAGIMAEALGWDEATIKHEIELYESRVEAQIEGEQKDDDEAADAARREAQDVRVGAS
ncbi:MAG: FAD-dependent oxidoreductase [Egibacteraceae bacterium]